MNPTFVFLPTKTKQSSQVSFLRRRFHYTDTSVLLENTPLVKFIRNKIRDSCGVFSISSLVKIYRWFHWYQVSLKLYLKFVGVWSKHLRVFLESPRQSSEIFVNLRKISKNVRQRSCDLRTNFRGFSEIFGKWSEIFGKSSKTPSSVCLHKIIEKRLPVSLKIWILCSRGKNNILLVRFGHSWDIVLATNIKFISRYRVISSVYFFHVTSASRNQT